jgi:hypothetical protein
MERQALIHLLALKDIRASAISPELKPVYETEALVLLTAKKSHKRFQDGRTSLYDDPRCRRPFTNDWAEAMSSMLKKRPYISCEVLCRHFRIAKGTCWRILHDMLGTKISIFVEFPMPWTQTRGLKESLYPTKFGRYYRAFVGFHIVITGDESWFFLYYPRDLIWPSSRDEVSERISQEN